MQKQGTITRWDATRAFGFIRSPDTAADVFFHVRDYRGAGAPCEGLAVMYEEIHVGGKGPRAMAVQPVARAAAPDQSRPTTAPPTRRAAAVAKPPADRAQGLRHPRRRSSSSSSEPPAAAGAALIYLLMLGWAALLAWGVYGGRLPLWVLGAAAGVNLLTVLVYAIDKNAAQAGQRRTRESHLHLLSLAGGWPGAWFAQQWLRHKSRKQPFRAVYWATVGLHCAAVAAGAGGWRV